MEISYFWNLLNSNNNYDKYNKRRIYKHYAEIIKSTIRDNVGTSKWMFWCKWLSSNLSYPENGFNV